MDPIQTFLNKLVHLYGDKAFQDEDQFLQLSEAHFSQSPGKRKVLALLIQKGVPKYLLSWKGIDEGPTKASAEQVRDSLVIKLTDANLASKEALYWAVSALLSVLIGREDLYPATQDRGQPNNASADGSRPTVSHAPIENAYARNSPSSGEGARAAVAPSVVPIAQRESPSGGRARVESNGSQQRKGGADIEPLHDRVEDAKSTYASAKNRVAEGISSFARTAKLALRAFVGLAVVGAAAFAYVSFSNRQLQCDSPEAITLVQQIVRQTIEGTIKQPLMMASSPSASTEEKAELAKRSKIIADQIQAIPIVVEEITVVSFNKDIGKYSCGAKMTGKLPDFMVAAIKGNPMAKAQVFAIGAMTNTDAMKTFSEPSAPIQYTIQRTVDKKQALVELDRDNLVIDAYKFGFLAYLGAVIEEVTGPRIKAEEQQRVARIAQAEAERAAAHSANYDAERKRYLEMRAKEEAERNAMRTTPYAPSNKKGGGY